MDNFIGPRNPITVTGYQVYCRAADGTWRPWQDGDHWKKPDFGQPTWPQVLNCGEGISFGLLCNQYYNDGLVVIQADQGDIFKVVQMVEPPVG